MGTRHLVAVQADGEYKVAQYGQWDGYPSGQGVKVLAFLTAPEFDKNAFAEAVRACSDISDEEYKHALVSCGADPEAAWVSMDVSGKFSKAYPHLHRDCGAGILPLIVAAGANGLKLNNYIEFAADSLFCEWAYVIDLDKNVLEVFEGFNKSPLEEGERFAHLPVEHSEYYQVKLLKSFDLDKLPDPKEFVTILDPEESN